MSKAKNKDTRILVVDDEPLMSDSLRQHLSDEGYAVDVSSSGTQAIDLFDGGAHHLVDLRSATAGHGWARSCCVT